MKLFPIDRRGSPMRALMLLLVPLLACENAGSPATSSEEGFAPATGDSVDGQHTPNAAAIAGLTLSPTAASLAPGQSVTFRPLGWIAGSNTPIAASVTWTATGGTITSAGVYTAGQVAGTFQVLAKSTTTAHTEPAVITIAGSPTAPTINSISVSPATTTMAAGAKQQFVATAQLSNGSSQANPSVTWSATGGSVSTDGLYTAGTTAGAFRVIARAANGRADTSAVTVTGASQAIVGLTLSPKSVSIAPGAKVTFQPQGWLPGSDTPVLASVTWTATGGAISSAGEYTAGSTPGTYQVTAKSTTTAHTESAVITISGSPVTPSIRSITLTPEVVSLGVGARQQFAVSANLSNGTTQASPAVTYTATGGTMSSSGLYTAGSSAGSYWVIARAANGPADTSRITVSAATLTSLVLTPATATVATRGTKQFTVSGTWSNGATTTPPVSYTATGGTISSSGLFTAGTAPGVFRVIAKHTGGTRADTSAVTVTAAATLKALSLTPASVSLATGATQQFAVTASWTDGSATVPPVTYSATGGSVSAGGLYTAGGTAGSYRVIVSHTSGTLKDTSTVTITGGGTGGGTELVSEGFEDVNIAGRRWFDATSISVANDGRPGSSGSKSLQWHWSSGTTAPQGSSRIDFAPTNSVYLSYWVKQSSNWIGSGRDYHPHMFHFLTTADDHYVGPSMSHLTLYDELIYDPSRGGSVPYLALQDALMIDKSKLLVNLTGVTEQRSIGGYNGRPESGVVWDCFDYGGGQYTNYKIFRPNAVVMTDANKNQWHHVESFWQLNTISGGKGQPDGVVQYWFDGQPLVDRRDIYFRTGVNASMQFRTFVMAPYIQDGSPRDQYMWIDDLVIRTSR